MDKQQRAFLKSLHYMMFENTEREHGYRIDRTFQSENEAIRNDQKIADCQVQQKMLDCIVGEFLRSFSL